MIDTLARPVLIIAYKLLGRVEDIRHLVAAALVQARLGALEQVPVDYRLPKRGIEQRISSTRHRAWFAGEALSLKLIARNTERVGEKLLTRIGFRGGGVCEVPRGDDVAVLNTRRQFI